MSRPLAPLHLPQFETDACGVGLVARTDGHKSHEILRLALRAAANLSHRGALDADGKTGDGAGVLAQLPAKLLAREAERLGVRAGTGGPTVVGMVFFPRNAEEACRTVIDAVLEREGFERLFWRLVPVDSSALGRKAAATQPVIMQVVARARFSPADGELNRKAYLARRRIEKALAEAGLGGCHFASFSHRTIVYKALVVAPDLPTYFDDLRDPEFTTALALFHQRYSTNTLPHWSLAQPFRVLAHNGEINTIGGNRNWMRAREPALSSQLWGADLRDLLPVIASDGSDSASLDNALEFLVVSGRSLEESVMQLIPEAYEARPSTPDEVRAFYEYKEGVAEPWDGPAAVVFSDGDVAGACLDRNGLRPARFSVTAGGLVVLASEAGVLDLPDDEIAAKGRLCAGEMILVDTRLGKVFSDQEIKARVARRLPYRRWLNARRRYLPRTDLLDEPPQVLDLRRKQRVFGWSSEDEKLLLAPMAAETKQPVGSMGNDTPLAVLSSRPRLLYDYFHETFAQVTNPPIDPLRESLVMSLRTFLGPRKGFLDDAEEQAEAIVLESPLLSRAQLAWLARLNPPFSSRTIDATFPVDRGEKGLEEAVERVCAQAESAVRAGETLLILTDDAASPERAPVPALLAVAAVHDHLIRCGLRMAASIIVSSGEPRSEHHFASLLGYGADAICPYLAYEAVAEMARAGQIPETSPNEALDRYRLAADRGILKIMSKMGISVLASYRGAELFEAVGLSRDLTERYFPATPSRVGGIGLRQIARDVLSRHAQAHANGNEGTLLEAGLFRFRRQGEYHAFNPSVFKRLHTLAKSGDYHHYKELVATLREGELVNLRDLVRPRPGKQLPLESVEPREAILRRFSASSMSLGALSAEAHETLAVAMNRIGAKSGSGEGGEDPRRLVRLPNGDSSSSKIKQIASGRFGVTPLYLRSATEIEIKMAQGSKPGEGGQLPGDKVTAEIAALRHATLGQPLISPPPHHDIYSIEDLAQLIYDLRQINPRAEISVKLVAAPGVGTVAAGVAKADADIVHISAYDGGTGASPLTSIKHAGLPWELGLAEAHQVLTANGLRGRVRLRVDGGMRTATDVIIAAALGADEFGFGSSLLVAAGCVMARQCHLNTCPVGIATQDETLRARFAGKPEMIVNYLASVADEVRELLAAMGLRCLKSMVGRADLLFAQVPKDHEKARLLDLGAILDPAATHGKEAAMRGDAARPRNSLTGGGNLGERILRDAQPALQLGESLLLSYEISNADRAVGTRLAGEIVARYGEAGLPRGRIVCKLNGTAGQSLGAFLVPGIRLDLVGEANDYVGKGMAGGEIVIRAPEMRSYRAKQVVLLGNTALYGATGGFLFAAGAAGERFAVRNSGAVAVVEGVGNHACEYMTRGTVVVLGPTGINFAAGMTGGVAYVLDCRGDFEERVNSAMVAITRVRSEYAAEELLGCLRRHLAATGSALAQAVIEEWPRYRPLFWQVSPAPGISRPRAQSPRTQAASASP